MFHFLSREQRMKAMASQKAKNRQRFALRLKRVPAELKPNDIEAAPIEVQVMLNDFSPTGVGLQSPVALPIGLQLSLRLEAPKPMVFYGRVIWYKEVHSDSRIISSKPMPYRIGIRFIIGSIEEERAIKAYCNHLAQDELSEEAA